MVLLLVPQAFFMVLLLELQAFFIAWPWEPQALLMLAWAVVRATVAAKAITVCNA